MAGAEDMPLGGMELELWENAFYFTFKTTLG